MTAARSSRAEARRRAVEAARRANEERAARDRANIKDATILLHALDKLDAIGEWKKARRAELRAQADAQLEREEAKRVGDERTAAGAAIERMRERGETLTTIATNHGVAIGAVRAMARRAPQAGKPLPRNGSHALGADGPATGEAAAGAAVGPDTGEPPAGAASA
ncbi:hypothetical protein [Mycolicibacterium grossiae]|uniref:Uncharacterized protein n=1 Tax=Mycolicibacterium grossiae TaxID=1552759 RepID=A0A1E8PXS2_9MYCO|nr:hypothetical protein [Mycolicibacterium grossiae]OFJ50896.1 hypothetical protein BEL07_25690 [Mycolicibacterium grossiae]QEM45683.1 hypothetical protein FZ046_13720 [Mycolicibacterium grossiae]